MKITLRWAVCYFLIISAICLITCICDVANEDFYKRLGVNKNASNEEIKKAYRKLAKIYHPDKNKDPQAEKNFQKIAEAYQTLSDPEKRRRYDLGGANFQSFQSTQGSGDTFSFRGFHFGDFEDIASQFADMSFFGGRKRSRFGGDSNFKIFEDTSDSFYEEPIFERNSFGSGRSYFGEQFGGGNVHRYSEQKYHSGGGCTTVTKRVGNTVTTYTTCS